MEATQAGSVLTLTNVTASDAGVFTCLAHNGVPREQPVTIREKLYLLVNRKFTSIKYFKFCILSEFQEKPRKRIESFPVRSISVLNVV